MSNGQRAGRGLQYRNAKRRTAVASIWRHRLGTAGDSGQLIDGTNGKSPPAHLCSHGATTWLSTLQDRLGEKESQIVPFVFHRNVRRIRGSGGVGESLQGPGVPGRIPHDLRRSAARNMKRVGLSGSVAMQLTGHETEAVYRRYTITSEADLEGVDRLNRCDQNLSSHEGRRGPYRWQGRRRNARRSVEWQYRRIEQGTCTS